MAKVECLRNNRLTYSIYCFVLQVCQVFSVTQKRHSANTYTTETLSSIKI